MRMQEADARLWLRRGAMALLCTLIGGILAMTVIAREACAAPADRAGKPGLAMGMDRRAY